MIGERGIRLFAGLIALALALWAAVLPAQANSGQTVGLFSNEAGAHDGYTLFAPSRSKTTYLIDNDGRLIHSWASAYVPYASAYLLEDGSLLRTAQIQNLTFADGGGRVERFAWDGTLQWNFEYSDADHQPHHDIRMLPNGNVLILAWEYKTVAEAIAAGRRPALLTEGQLWPEHVIEVEPTGASGGNIVWEWHVWDHMIQEFDATKDNYGVVADHPELIHINYPGAGVRDWLHANALDYNPQLDQIIVNVLTFGEFWVIDHSTTSAEAAGHTGGNSGKGGDLLYRWGNPEAYRAGGAGDQKLFAHHNAQWIEPGLPGAGNILVFNNGRFRTGGDYSSVDEIVPPVDGFGNYSLAPGQAYGPAELTWTYALPNDLYSSFISGAQRQPNGNTLIDAGPLGTFIEVTPDGTVVWKYINPVTDTGPLAQGDPVPPRGPGLPGQKNLVFRAYRYAPDYPGLYGQDLTPGAPIETIDPDADTDKDGMTDGYEVAQLCLQYTLADATTDADADGLSNLQESQLGTGPCVSDTDTDGDGCTDGQELGPDERLGGQRNPLDPWDYFNPTGDKQNRVDDILAVAQHFGLDSGDLGYDTRYDRTYMGPNAWNTGPPDGTVSVADILAILHLYGHDCA